jgi:tRNA pseudouridine55 synthase
MQGFLLVNKPVGVSSYFIVAKIKKMTAEKKVGHAGTLDPFAAGLLIIAIGREYTKKIGYFQDLEKEYRVRMALGIKTDSLDAYGNIMEKKPINIWTKADTEKLKQMMTSFQGEYRYHPPMFSAKKVAGKRLYKYAREGITIKRQTIQSKIEKIILHKVDFYKTVLVDFSVVCAKGTYVRSLVNDMGIKVGFGAYVKDLERRRIGKYLLENAITYHTLDTQTIKEKIFKESNR